MSQAPGLPEASSVSPPGPAGFLELSAAVAFLRVISSVRLETPAEIPKTLRPLDRFGSLVFCEGSGGPGGFRVFGLWGLALMEIFGIPRCKFQHGHGLGMGVQHWPLT